MESIENKIKQELEKKNIHKNNYIWIVSILVFTVIIILYSYTTNEGIIAKQTINTQLVVKNQENIRTNAQEKKVTHEKIVEQELSQEEILKEAIVKDIIEKNIKNNTKKVSEDNLDETSDDNILIDDEEQILLAEQELEEKIPQNVAIENETIATLPATSKTEEPLKSIETPKIEPIAEEKIVVVKNSNQTEVLKIFEPKTNFNFYQCYSFSLAQYSFPQSCAGSLNEFMNSNSGAKRFEIIGVIDIEDAKNLSNKSDSSQALLAKNRIISTRNFIKSKTKTPISDHFYYIKSELPTRGFALRAYY